MLLPSSLHLLAFAAVAVVWSSPPGTFLVSAYHRVPVSAPLCAGTRGTGCGGVRRTPLRNAAAVRGIDINASPNLRVSSRPLTRGRPSSTRRPAVPRGAQEAVKEREQTRNALHPANVEEAEAAPPTFLQRVAEAAMLESVPLLPGSYTPFSAHGPHHHHDHHDDNDLSSDAAIPPSSSAFSGPAAAAATATFEESAVEPIDPGVVSSMEMERPDFLLHPSSGAAPGGAAAAVAAGAPHAEAPHHRHHSHDYDNNNPHYGSGMLSGGFGGFGRFAGFGGFGGFFEALNARLAENPAIMLDVDEPSL
eukprot:GHVU01133767.1.p1 GENE.GHVU01133767.1~~GHVU01133767.1.p1  ORF type:complete len:306 (-),score=41.02 GHVU01133767.1:649-1566(-)